MPPAVLLSPRPGSLCDAWCVEASLVGEPPLADDEGYQSTARCEQKSCLGESSESLVGAVDADDDGVEAIEHVAHLLVVPGRAVDREDVRTAAGCPRSRRSARTEAAVAAARIETMTPNETATGTW